MGLNILLMYVNSMQSGDLGTEAILQEAGHTVTRINYATSLPANIYDYDVLVLSSVSAGTPAVPSQAAWKSLEMPVIALTSLGWRGTYAMSAGTDTAGSGTDIVVQADSGIKDGAGHPIAVAAGITGSGTWAIYTVGGSIHRDSVIGPGAKVIAWRSTVPQKTLFGYETNAILADSSSAAGPRWAYGLGQNAHNANTLGKNILLSILNYVTATYNNHYTLSVGSYADILVTPDTPSISFTYSNYTASLAGTEFSAGGWPHSASQWQITSISDPTFSNPIVNPGPDTVNLTQLTLTGTSTGSFLARVRYRT